MIDWLKRNIYLFFKARLKKKNKDEEKRRISKTYE